jgi:hypothetical protein
LDSLFPEELREIDFQAEGIKGWALLAEVAPALGILLGGRHHLSLQPPDLAPLVEGDHVDAQLLGDIRHTLAVGWPHPPADISLDGLAVRTHRSIPSGPLVVEVVRMERRQLSWQRGANLLK